MRKVNADKRPRIKGRFVKPEELQSYLNTQAELCWITAYCHFQNKAALSCCILYANFLALKSQWWPMWLRVCSHMLKQGSVSGLFWTLHAIEKVLKFVFHIVGLANWHVCLVALAWWCRDIVQLQLSYSRCMWIKYGVLILHCCAANVNDCTL